MEIIIALILLIIMYLFETNKVYHFVDYISKNNNITKKNRNNVNSYSSKELIDINCSQDILPKNNKKKQVIWIFDIYEVSSSHWQSFYSRKTRQPMSSIVSLCIDTIRDHSSNHFIRVFNQNHIKKLLPEYEKYIKNCNSFYLAYNFIKFAMLYKYGGIWIPSDTIMLKELRDTDFINDNKIITFGINNTNLVNSRGFSDTILACREKNTDIKKIVNYLIKEVATFQNNIYFTKGVNMFFNKVIKNSTNHYHSDQMLAKKNNNKYINTDDLFSTNLLVIDDICKKSLVHINLFHINNLPQHNYLSRMSKKQILDSKLFLSELLRYSL